MPNVLDMAPLVSCVRRAARLLPDPAAAQRFERVALAHLVRDEKNFRPALQKELLAGPGWVSAALERGDQISVFIPRRGVGKVLGVARQLASVCKLARRARSDCQKHAALVARARRMVAALDRMDFSAIAEQARTLAQRHAAWRTEADQREVCPPAVIAACEGAVWIRVQSVARLREIGREFGNCLARPDNYLTYADPLRKGRAEFWVLRTNAGAGRIVAMVSTGAPRHFMEVKGLGNAHIAPRDADLLALASALGFVAERPPTTRARQIADELQMLLRPPMRFPARFALTPRVREAAPPRILVAAQVERYALRVARRHICDRGLATWFARLAFQWLIENPCNFRPATDAELARAPSWARSARDRGEALGMFKVSRRSALGLNRTGRDFAATMQLAAYAHPAGASGSANDQRISDEGAALAAQAEPFLGRRDASSFEQLAARARAFVVAHDALLSRAGVPMLLDVA